jgi:transcriptional coactivator HFI1/ADA1
MPDIDPAALSRPSLISTTPILPPKISTIPVPQTVKTSKSNHVPARIDLEPLYTALKAAIGEYWNTYKDAVSGFVMGEFHPFHGETHSF